MNRYRLTLAAAVCCALSLYFVDGETQQQLEKEAETQAESAIQTETGPTAKPEAEADDQPAVDEQATDQAADNEAHKLAFEPPFPDRTNLFQAPKRQGRGRSTSKGQSETSVELLGFVNVNGQRVALSIDGLVTTIAEGGKEYGIEVISIQPPSVFLRRGKQRWQASFEN